MTALARLLPEPALVEIDAIEVAAGPEVAWERVRHGDLGGSALIRALFALRTLPDRLRGEAPETRLRIDDLVSTPAEPGFSILVDDPPRSPWRTRCHAASGCASTSMASISTSPGSGSSRASAVMASLRREW
ncbi:MAG: hypothetical protein JHC74_07850 [Thermoleophilia bacterium]|nr:hypothetical protein [Thermoleophilia bacterium]